MESAIGGGQVHHVSLQQILGSPFTVHHHSGENVLLWKSTEDANFRFRLVLDFKGLLELQLATKDHTNTKLDLRSGGIKQLNLKVGLKQGRGA